jgi:hypothetical protein
MYKLDEFKILVLTKYFDLSKTNVVGSGKYSLNMNGW